MVTSVAFSPDGKILACGLKDDGLIKFWNVATGQELKTFYGGHISSWSIAFTPDGKVLAVGGYQAINLLDTATGQFLRTLEERHSSLVNAVAFSPDGKLLATASGDSKSTNPIKLWDVTTGKY